MSVFLIVNPSGKGVDLCVSVCMCVGGRVLIDYDAAVGEVIDAAAAVVLIEYTTAVFLLF